MAYRFVPMPLGSSRQATMSLTIFCPEFSWEGFRAEIGFNYVVPTYHRGHSNRHDKLHPPSPLSIPRFPGRVLGRNRLRLCRTSLLPMPFESSRQATSSQTILGPKFAREEFRAEIGFNYAVQIPHRCHLNHHDKQHLPRPFSTPSFPGTNSGPK